MFGLQSKYIFVDDVPQCVKQYKFWLKWIGSMCCVVVGNCNAMNLDVQFIFHFLVIRTIKFYEYIVYTMCV